MLDGNVQEFLSQCLEFASDDKDVGKALVLWFSKLKYPKKATKPMREREAKALPKEQQDVLGHSHMSKRLGAGNGCVSTSWVV